MDQIAEVDEASPLLSQLETPLLSHSSTPHRATLSDQDIPCQPLNLHPHIMESIFGQKTSSSSTFTPTGGAGTGTGQFSLPSGLQNVQTQLEKARCWTQHALKNGMDTLRFYINQYPPLAAFLFTLLLLSAVPVSIFVVFGVVTSVFFLSIALIGFSAVEGTILLTTGGILFAVLGGIALFTTCAFGFLALCYMGYRGTCVACNQLWQGASYVGSKVQEQSSQFMPQQSSSSSYQQQQPQMSRPQ